MAEQGRREVVPDQFAFNAREQAPERSLATIGVRNPGQTGGPTRSASRALEGLYGALGDMAGAVSDDMITEGKLNYMRGMSEAEALSTGNNFTQQGYQALNTVDKGNSWYLAKMGDMETDAQMDPKDYQKKLMDERAYELNNLPDDPAVRKLYVAAFEDKGPALIAKQYEAHMAYNQGQAYNAAVDSLMSSSAANIDATRVMPGSTLRVSPTRIDTAIMGNESDRENGILTLLGEAGGEGDQGMAAVAHVIKNRVTDKRWGGSVTDVVKAEKQFSVWNDGGVSLSKYKGTAAYERAGQIYDAVMNGFTADMTNGATNYFAPKGMEGGKNPDWLSIEAARSGGTIKIGGHIFAGKTGMAGYVPKYESDPATGERVAQPQQGELVFAHRDQTDIEQGFAGILKESAAAMGMPYKITSGHRDASHPVEAAKKNGGGEHTHRDAVDIDLSGMSDEQRSAVVADLRSRGVKRFGLYSTSPNMLHVDMNSRKVSPDDWFMYDKSKNNMGIAPKWYQELAQSETGKPMPKGYQPQVATLLQNMHIPPAMKATALADAMRRQLAQGSDQLFNDAGGVAKIIELGGKPNEVDEVLKAKEQMDKKALDSFDVAFERKRSDLFERIRAGEFSNEGDLTDIVQQMYASKQVNDSNAKSLLRSAQAEFEKLHEGENAILPKPFLFGAEQIYRKISIGAYTGIDGKPSTQAAYDEISTLAKENGVPDKQAQSFLKRVLSEDKARFDKDLSDAQALAKATATSDALKDAARQALSQDRGFANLPQGTVDDNGIKKPVKQFAIDELKRSIGSTLQDGVERGQIKQENATGILYKEVYKKLAKNGVVDEEGSKAFSAAIRGDFIIKSADGKRLIVREDAKDAFNAYMMMKNTPEIGAAYAASMFPDDDVRVKLEQADRMYSMNMDIDTAMAQAQLQLSDKTFDPQAVSKQYYDKIESTVDTAIQNAIGNGGFLARSAIGMVFKTTEGKYEDNLRTLERGKATNYIRDKADAYKAAYPNASPEAVIEMAKQDFENNMVQVRGQMLIGDRSKGTRLDQLMGVDSFGPTGASDAINLFIEQRGKYLWPDLYEKSIPAHKEYPWSAPGPNVSLTFDQNSGIVGFRLLDAKGVPQGAAHFVRAEDIGKDYIEEKKNPSFIAKAYDAATDALTTKAPEAYRAEQRRRTKNNEFFKF